MGFHVHASLRQACGQLFVVDEKRRGRGREREMGTAGVLASKESPSRYIAGIACTQRLSSEHACDWDLEGVDLTSWCWMGVAHTTSSSQIREISPLKGCLLWGSVLSWESIFCDEKVQVQLHL